MTDGLNDARALLPGVPLGHLDTLGGSDRSVVRRVTAGARTLIVKTYTSAGEGWVRESAGLSVLPAGAPAPRLVAEGDAPPIVVMSDAGCGANVADALLGSDPDAAARAVVSWATAIASMHRTTAGSRDAFRAALAARAGDWPVGESALPTDLEDAGRVVARHGAEVGVEIPSGALDELRDLGVRLGGDGPAALTPADACPDNNVRVGDDLVLIDFENAQWRHVAWDIAYLLVPWPTCWCSWRIPEGVAERAIGAYRSAAGLPYLDTPGFGRDVAAAAVGWAFISTSWFLSRALADDPPLTDPSQPAPTRRAMIQHRLDGARRQDQLPALADWADRLHTRLAAGWGVVDLAFAPAFAR